MRVYGPFRTAADIRCDGAPAVEGSFDDLRARAPTRPRPCGWSGRAGTSTRRSSRATTSHVGLDDALRRPARSASRSRCSPPSHTIVSAPVDGARRDDLRPRRGQRASPARRVTVNAALYGPFAGARRRSSAPMPPLWTRLVRGQRRRRVPHRGRVTLTVPGYYTYVESIAGASSCARRRRRAARSSRPPSSTGTPPIAHADQRAGGRARRARSPTRVRRQRPRRARPRPCKVELWGPYATREAMTCTGTPYCDAARSPPTATARTRRRPSTLDSGRLLHLPRVDRRDARRTPRSTTACGEATETTLVSATPVRHHGRLRRGRAAGLPRSATRSACAASARRRRASWSSCSGPFATRDAIRCDGDAVLARPGHRAGRRHHPRRRPCASRTAGFYTYRERLLGAPNVDGHHDGVRARRRDRARRRPPITTGRGDVARERARRRTPAGARRRACASAPGHRRAGHAAWASTCSNGALGVPGRASAASAGGATARRRATATGAVLIAGHVDSATAGRRRLLPAATGRAAATASGRDDRDGRTCTLPRHVGAHDAEGPAADRASTRSRGAARLVLVTCGGPFDPVAGHYRDNVVVTAVPA